MKKIALIVTLALVIPLFANAAGSELNWYTDINLAKTAAQKDNKPLFLFFTGSDWCIWCKRLNSQILTQEAFKKYANEALIMVKLDFPKFTQQDQKQKEHNVMLARQYQVQGFPTIMLLNSQGTVLGRTGYADLSPEGYVEHLKTFIK